MTTTSTSVPGFALAGLAVLMRLDADRRRAWSDGDGDGGGADGTGGDADAGVGAGADAGDAGSVVGDARQAVSRSSVLTERR